MPRPTDDSDSEKMTQQAMKLAKEMGFWGKLPSEKEIAELPPLVAIRVHIMMANENSIRKLLDENKVVLTEELLQYAAQFNTLSSHQKVIELLAAQTKQKHRPTNK